MLFFKEKYFSILKTIKVFLQGKLWLVFSAANYDSENQKYAQRYIFKAFGDF